MIASFFFIALGLLFGFVLLRALKTPLTIEEQLIWAGPIGLMLLTFLVFLLALVLPNQNLALTMGSAVAAIVGLYYLNRDQHRALIVADWYDLHKRLDKPERLAWLAILVPWLLYTLLTVPWLMFYRDGNLIAGWINTWGDWAVHLRTSTFFATQERLTLESPIWSGSQFHYPYLASYLSSLLQRLGLDLARSLTWPTFILFSVLPPMLYLLGRRITNHRTAAVIFTYLFLLAGGLGVYWLVNDLLTGTYFWEASAYSPKTYTDMFRVDGLSANTSIWLMNFIMSEFFPQRAFLAGIGIALYVLYMIWISFGPDRHTRDQPDRANLLFTGALYGILPIVHTHSFVAISLALAGIWGYQTASQWLQAPANQRLTWSWWQAQLTPLGWFLGPAVVLGTIILFTFVFNRQQTDTFIERINWWVPRQEEPVEPISYWWKNAGPFIVLAFLTSLFWAARYRALFLGGLIVFIVCNRITFQPWQFDNLKILTYWYLLWSIPIAVSIANIKEFRWGRWAQIFLIFLLTGAGLADTLTVTVSRLNGGLQLATKDDLTFAQLVNTATVSDPKGLIVAATNHDNPLSLTSGRPLYMGYEGWLWTYGIRDWAQRLLEIEKIYRGEAEGLALIKEKHIHYLAIGPQERDRFQPDEMWFVERFPTIVEYNGYRLLDVRQPADQP